MKPFREIHAQEAAAACLREELETRGYVLIRNLLPREDILRSLGEVLEIIAGEGWLLQNDSPWDRLADAQMACGESDPRFEHVYRQIFGLESFHALAHHPKLRVVMKAIVGPRLLVHPKPIGRLIFPNCERFVIQSHQDHWAIGGDSSSYTAWMPLHDCPIELGPLQVLESSHHFGLQNADPTTGMIAGDRARGGEWVSGSIHAGDVLIFHSLTVHSASPNISRHLRISVDCRFQDHARPINPANLVFPGTSGRSWETTYAGWQSEGLQYFWKQMPLTFRPSVDELAELAETAESPKMRLRYARILSQIQSQLQDV